MRKLASIQRVEEVRPIEGADAIDVIRVLGWECVIKKGEFAPGDLCIYIEVDSLLPDIEALSFMSSRKFRIKTIKLRGQISQGLAVPTTILDKSVQCLLEPDMDVTELLGITKYEKYSEPVEPKTPINRKPIKPWVNKWVPRWLRILIMNKFPWFYTKNFTKKHIRTFPDCIPKTDETRVQSYGSTLVKHKGTSVYITEKLDGSSITIFKIKNEVGVCSRNLRLPPEEGSKYWDTVRELGIDSSVANINIDNFAIQGELIGEGIQGNKYKLKGNDIRIFGAFMIDERRYCNYDELVELCNRLNVQMVPVLAVDIELHDNVDAWVQESISKSTLNPAVWQEGVVIASMGAVKGHGMGRLSFKSINPNFLLKYDE